MNNEQNAQIQSVNNQSLQGIQPFSLRTLAVPPAQVALRSGSPKFLTHVHRLRAIAILSIVAVHCVGFFGWKIHPLLDAFLVELFQNSSVLFVFVAGFLFQHLSTSFRYSDYIVRKTKNVLIPYIIVATPAIAYAVLVENPVIEHPELRGTSLIYQIGWFYINGGATTNWALWFIPVIALYYVAAPVFMTIQERPYLYGILWALVPLSLLAHRPTFTGGHNLQFALYFLSAYVLGMYCSQQGQKALEFINAHLVWLLGAFTIILIAHTFASSRHGIDQVQRIFTFDNGYIDWLFLQKLALTIFLLGFLARFNKINMPMLDYVADVSFTIYFIHMYVLAFIARRIHYAKPEGNLTYVLLLIFCTIAISSFVAYLARRTFGSRSRILLGS